ASAYNSRRSTAAAGHRPEGAPGAVGATAGSERCRRRWPPARGRPTVRATIAMMKAPALLRRRRIRAALPVLASAASRRQSSPFAFAVLAQPVDVPFGRKQITAMIGRLQTRRVMTMQTTFEQHLGNDQMVQAVPARPAEPIDGLADTKIFDERADTVERRAANQHRPCDPALEWTRLLRLQRGPLRFRQFRAREGADKAEH